MRPTAIRISSSWCAEARNRAQRHRARLEGLARRRLGGTGFFYWVLEPGNMAPPGRGTAPGPPATGGFGGGGISGFEAGACWGSSLEKSIAVFLFASVSRVR